MVIQVGIVVATYLGIRLYEKFKKIPTSQAGKERVAPEEEPANLALAQDTLEEQGNQREQQLQHYSRIGLASMGLFAVKGFLPVAGPLGLAAYSYAAVPYMRDVEKALLTTRKANLGHFFFVGDLLALGSRWYFGAALGLWMMLSGKTFVEKVKNDSRKILTSLFAELPQRVWVLIDNVEIEVPLEEVKTNDIVMIKAGEVIPFAGKITEGVGQVFQQALTGEFQSVEKRAGDTLVANTFLLTGRLRLQVRQDA